MSLAIAAAVVWFLAAGVMVVATEVRRRRPVERYFIDGKRVSKEEFDRGWPGKSW